MPYTEEDLEKVQDENTKGPEDYDDDCNWYNKYDKPNTEDIDG